MKFRKTIFAASLLAATAMSAPLFGQGCVAAHTNQRAMNELIAPDAGGSNGLWSIHNLTVDIGYRVYNSNKYFVGTDEIARPNAVENHQNIFDVGLEYRLSPRLTLNADIPVFNGTRNQIYPPTGIYQVSGLGDITVGLQSWILRPPTEGHGNVAVSLALKAPTGIDNATGTGLSKGQYIKATTDQSLQPGDGGWGFAIGTQGYRTLWRHADAYGQGQYLFNPADTNGVATFRTKPGQGVDSVADQYLFRAGISQGVTFVRGLAFSIGIRSEGVPVRDLIGNSNGFRRPGSIQSVDPGVMWNFRKTTLSINGPWAVRRNRPPSVPEIANNTANGDAFFADYTVIAGLSHHF